MNASGKNRTNRAVLRCPLFRVRPENVFGAYQDAF